MDVMVKYDEDVKWRLKFAKPGDVGLDLPVKIQGSKIRMPNCEHLIKPNGDDVDTQPWLEIPSHTYAELEIGVRLKLPEDAFGLITGRSSTAWKRQLMVIQGIIDTNYTGYLRTLVYNPDNAHKRIHGGDRLSQIIILSKYDIGKLVEVDELPTTERGQSGFGSSGV